ncbi:helix-turn-helix domain-containing protein [soil metagenome]
MKGQNKRGKTIECNTSALASGDRAEIWGDTVRAAFGSVNVMTEKHGETLFGHLKSDERDMLRFNSLHYRGQSHHRTPVDIARLKNEYITLTRPNVGKLEIDFGNSKGVLEPGNLYLFNHAVPYYAKPHIEYGTTSIAFPASTLRQRGVKLLPLHVLSMTSRQGSLIHQMADQLTVNYLKWSDQEFSVLTEQLLDLIALFFFTPGSVQTFEESGVRSAHLRRAIHFIQSNFGDPELTPGKIAAACGISVSYLHNLFSSTETSVEATVLSERLEQSKKMLSSVKTGFLSIGAIAYMSGFSHPAHFSRVFRQKVGRTPREFRNLILSLDAGDIANLA